MTRRYSEHEVDEALMAGQLERARQRAADPDWVLVDDEYSDLLGPTWRYRPTIDSGAD